MSLRAHPDRNAAKIQLIAAILLASADGLIAGAHSDSPPEVILNIESRSLADSIHSWAEQTGYQVLMPAELCCTNTPLRVLKGSYTPEGALSELLRNTAFDFQRVNARTVVISSSRVLRSEDASQQSDTGVMTERVPRGERAEASLQEVIVSAQKRIEPLQSVPLSVTAVDPRVLINTNRIHIQDYLAGVPGVSAVSSGKGDVNLSIRGVTTGAGFANPTVGVVLDEAPFGATTALAGFRTPAPDLDLNDLERIEILRGPQSTLYGVSSLGGVVKFVTVDPSMSSWAGRIQASLNNVSNSRAASYGLSGMLNAPINDRLAIRASAFSRREAGYIDAPALHSDGVNSKRSAGARVSGLWRPSTDLSVKLSALVQNLSADGASYSSNQPGLGSLEQVLNVRGAGGYSQTIGSAAMTVNAALESVNVTSITAYSINRFHLISDITEFLGSVPEELYSASGAVQSELDKTGKFTQELRIAAASTRLQWLLGAFYTHEDSPNRETALAAESQSGATIGVLVDDPFPSTFAELALFGNLTLHLTTQFDLQVGVRESRNQQSYEESVGGPAWGEPVVTPLVHTRDDALSYLLAPRLTVSDRLMFYGRLASGYRAGGPNPMCVLFVESCHYRPDRARNYELGIRGASNSLSYATSAYYTGWQDLQIPILDPDTGVAHFSNTRSARIRGLEFEAQWQPRPGMTIGGWATFNDAVLTSDLPSTSAVVGTAGEQLPFSSRFSSYLSVDQEFSLGRGRTLTVSARANYTGPREDEFGTIAAPRVALPGYCKGDLQIGVKDREWTLTLFVNNISDKRGLLNMPRNTPTVLAATYIEPRTMGLTVSRSLGTTSQR